MTDTPEAQLAYHARRLADAIDRSIPVWVRDQIQRVLTTQAIAVTPEIARAAEAAAALARSEVGRQVRKLLESEVDDQQTTPLALLRRAVEYPTAVLAACGAVPSPRDRFVAEAFPADIYDLSPATFAELDPSDAGLADAGLAWGAAKAFVHHRRHRGAT